MTVLSVKDLYIFFILPTCCVDQLHNRISAPYLHICPGPAEKQLVLMIYFITEAFCFPAAPSFIWVHYLILNLRSLFLLLGPINLNVWMSITNEYACAHVCNFLKRKRTAGQESRGCGFRLMSILSILLKRLLQLLKNRNESLLVKKTYNIINFKKHSLSRYHTI